MLDARDYYPAHDWTTATIEDFVDRVDNVDDFVLSATKIGDSKSKMCVFFPQLRVNKAALMQIRETATQQGAADIILCGRTDMTGATRQLIRADPDFNIQYFTDWTFLVNLPDHDMVPQHVVLTGE